MIIFINIDNIIFINTTVIDRSICYIWTSEGWRDKNNSFPLHPSLKTPSASFRYLQTNFPLPFSSPHSYSLSTLWPGPLSHICPSLWCLPGIVGDHVVVNGQDSLRIWPDPGNLQNRIFTFKKYLQPTKMWNQNQNQVWILYKELVVF